MLDRLPLFIGLRYAGSRRRSQLVSFISLVSMLGMTIGVAMLVIVLSVMNGFDREMRQRILSLVPHISIQSYRPDIDWQHVAEQALLHPEVEAVSPFVQLNGMLVYGRAVEGVLVRGIDPAQERNTSIIDQFVDARALTDLVERQGVLIGLPLAQKLKVSMGDSVNLMLPMQSDSGRLAPRFKRLQIVGIFDTGTELDQSVAMMYLPLARELAAGQGQGLRVKLTDTFAAPRVAWELDQSMAYGLYSRDWTRSHGNLYSAIQLSKRLVGLMLLTIIAVAAFNVVSALVMVVTDKQGDIAILRTLGASPAKVMAVFMVQGTMIGVMGTTVGVVLGVLAALTLPDLVAMLEHVLHYQFLNSDVYPVNYLPVDLRLQDVALVAGTALAMSLLATVYPAWRAAKVLPAIALRHE